MILQQQFTLAQIAEALGKNPATPRTHINRGYVVAQGPRAPEKKDEGGKPEGKHRRFSFFAASQFAMAYKLEAAGLQLPKAFEYAAEFAHGGGDGLFGLPERFPGLPFHHNHGTTIFAAGCGRGCEDLWKHGGGYDTYGNIRSRLKCDDFVTVNASAVFNTLCRGLGVQPREALDEAYPEDAS